MSIRLVLSNGFFIPNIEHTYISQDDLLPTLLVGIVGILGSVNSSNVSNVDFFSLVFYFIILSEYISLSSS